MFLEYPLQIWGFQSLHVTVFAVAMFLVPFFWIIYNVAELLPVTLRCCAIIYNEVREERKVTKSALFYQLVLPEGLVRIDMSNLRFIEIKFIYDLMSFIIHS